MKKKLLVAMVSASMMMYACSIGKEVQADFVDVELIKIDTVFRYPKDEMVLTFQCQNKIQLVSYVPIRGQYRVGSVYKVLLTK